MTAPTAGPRAGRGPPGLVLVGAVLAGGASRRLGRDKAAELVGETRMIDRAVEALRPSCREVVVVSSRADTPTGPWLVIGGERPDTGPLAGVEAALDHAADREADAVFVLACDLPMVDAETVALIVRALGHGEDSGAGAREGEERRDAAAARRQGVPDFEPLCAAYRVSVLPRLRSLLDAGDTAARRLFEVVRGVRVDTVPGRLLNVNTESELTRARLAHDLPHEATPGGGGGDGGVERGKSR